MWGFGKGFAVLLSAAALISIGIGIGDNRRQLNANTENIHILQQALASEVNSRTATDAQTVMVTTKLDDILRRLDRIERRIQ